MSVLEASLQREKSGSSAYLTFESKKELKANIQDAILLNSSSHGIRYVPKTWTFIVHINYGNHVSIFQVLLQFFRLLNF